MTTTPPLPSFTKLWHNDTYPALSPVGRAKGKTIVITGASGGIGRATAVSFVKAGATRIALLGRRREALQGTEKAVKSVDSHVQTSIHICSSVDHEALRAAAVSIGRWDVLILAAGVNPPASPIETADIDTWWSGFETNVKGTFVTAKVFLPFVNDLIPDKPPTIICLNAALVFTPDFPVWAGSSAYTSSKLALLQVMHHISKENPTINVVSVHPGIVDTGMLTVTEDEKAYMNSLGLIDAPELPGDFLVWASTKEGGEVVKGKFVFANWDIEEMMARKSELEKTNVLTVGLMGWPFDKQ